LVLPGAVLAGGSPVTLTVTTLTDEFDTNIAACSLREAVQAANTNANFGGCVHDGSTGTDTIDLMPGVYNLTGAQADDMNVEGDLDVDGGGGPLIFDGAPIDATTDRPLAIIDGGNANRQIDLVQDNPDVELQALELRNGSVTGDGGAVQVDDGDARLIIDTVIFTGNDAGDYGGAVYYPDGTTNSRFSIEQSEFAGNTAGEEGGALWLDIPEMFGFNPTINNSAFVGNTAAEMGGALYLGTRAVDAIFLEVTNTTISGNSATLGGGALAFDLSETGNASFQFSTIADNTTATAGQGGGIRAITVAPEDQFVQLNNSIVAGNTAAGAPSNCAGPGNFQGGNSIESTNSCGLSLATSLVDTDPQLAPVGFYPGQELTTRTHGLYDTSPAVDKSPVGQCSGMFPVTVFDQRYVARPVGGACDTGAHEGTVGPNPNPPAGGANPTTPVTPVTPTTKCKKKKKKKKKRSAAAAKKKKKKGCKKKKKKKKK
jgi:CSLREA domain-containing protein